MLSGKKKCSDVLTTISRNKQRCERIPSFSKLSFGPTGLTQLGRSTAGTTCSRIYRCAHIIAGERGRYTTTIISTPRSMKNSEGSGEQPDELASCGRRLSLPFRLSISFRAFRAAQTNGAGFPVEYLVRMREGGACPRRIACVVGMLPPRSSSGQAHNRSTLEVPMPSERELNRHRHRFRRGGRTMLHTSKERRVKASARAYSSRVS